MTKNLKGREECEMRVEKVNCDFWGEKSLMPRKEVNEKHSTL